MCHNFKADATGSQNESFISVSAVTRGICKIYLVADKTSIFVVGEPAFCTAIASKRQAFHLEMPLWILDMAEDSA